jgi:hypothetical protein
MSHTMRPANLFDLLNIVASRRKQRVLRLNPPYTLVQPETLLPDLIGSQLPMKPRSNFVYVYSEQGRVLGYVQARCRWRRRDEWTITTLAATDKAPERVWECLLEEVCRAAGEQEVIRLFVKVPKDEPQLNTFRSLGFTPYTNEAVWGRLYFSQNSSTAKDDPRSKLLRRREARDAWDLMQLYSAVTPPVVQRAEMLTTRQWHVSRLPRPLLMSPGLLENSYVWQDESGNSEGLGGYVRLLTGTRGHWITTLYRPDPGNREMVPVALDHVLWKASRLGHKPVYCGLREYQAEVGSILEEGGFHLLSEQALLVKYLAAPIKERQPALVPFLATNENLVPTK